MDYEEFTIRRLLSVKSAYSPSFDYKGDRIAFISDISGVPQVWVWEKGEVDQLTPFGERVAAASFSPSRSQLAFSMDAGGDEFFQIYLLEHGKICLLYTSDAATICSV